jgi:hypothetical protein
MPEFIPGLTLSRRFFDEAVRPIMANVTPDLEYAAGLIGSGSEVLGFDDEMSSDHHWGPRVMLFVDDADLALKQQIDQALRDKLPTTFLGYSTNFAEPNPDDNNTQLPVEIECGPVNHRVDIFSIREYLLAYLNFDIDLEIEPADWLTFPDQKLRSLSPANVFHDDIGLRDTLNRFACYPHDVWLYLLACGWSRIGQEEHLMGRTGFAGDEIGSALMASRLVRDIMRLCFLMERKYAPYPKWFGTAFRQLECASNLEPHLTRVLSATSWQEREKHLVRAYELIALMHNDLGITEPLPTKPENFFGRPFKVIDATGGFAKAILAVIEDPTVREIAKRKPIGSIDQFSDSTDLLSDSSWRITLRKLYERQ